MFARLFNHNQIQKNKKISKFKLVEESDNTYCLWAKLANSCYDIKLDVGQTVAEYFKVFSVFKKFPYPDNLSYRGAFFWPPQKNNIPPPFMVLGARGTEPTEIDSLLNDFDILCEKIPRQFSYAVNYMRDEFKIIQNLYRDQADAFKDMAMIFTGHSLGGVIAVCQLATFIIEHPDHYAEAVIFDNPGAYPAVLCHLMKNHHMSEQKAMQFMTENLYDRITNIQSDVNAINTCKKQLGQVFHLSVPYFFEKGEDPKAPYPIMPTYLTNLHYIQTYTFHNQHALLQMIDALKTCHEFEAVNWPSGGLLNGYNAYLNPDSTSDHRRYWQEYAEYIWTKNSSIQKRYKDKFEDFFKFFKKELAVLRGEIPSIKKPEKIEKIEKNKRLRF